MASSFRNLVPAMALATILCTSAAAEDVLMKNPLAAVTVEDFKSDLLRVPEDQREGFLQNLQRISRLTENLLINKSLSEMARRGGMDKDPVVERRVRLQLEKVLAELYIEQFEKDKAREFDQRRADFERRAAELYAVEKPKFLIPERVSAWHILIRTEGKDPVDARKRIDAVVARLQKGEDFQAVAAEVSEDPGSAPGGGGLPTFARQQMEIPFADAAFALREPGELSPVVQTRYGYHVIKLKERFPARQQSYDEVKGGILAQLKAQHVKEAREVLYRSLFEPPGFEADMERMRALQTFIDKKAAKPR